LVTLSDAKRGKVYRLTLKGKKPPPPTQKHYGKKGTLWRECPQRKSHFLFESKTQKMEKKNEVRTEGVGGEGRTLP